MSARITGLIGYPTEHSLSPVIHGYWLKKYHIEAEYKLFTTPPSRLRQTMLHMRKKNVLGVNITVPHKQAVMEYLDAVDDVAERIGAVNTVINKNGRFIGSNTDAYGFMANLKAALTNFLPYQSCALVLGAGGAARAVIAALKEAGVARIMLTNRTSENAHALAAHMGCEPLVWNAKEEALKEVALLVNTTSLGMKANPPLELTLDTLPQSAAVCDIVYAPRITALLNDAAARGNKTVSGLGMLVYQAQKAFELWHGVMPEVTEELFAMLEAKR